MRKRIIYGYELENGVMETHADQKEIVERIFSDYIAGESIRGIARALNAEGIPSPDGKRWVHRAIGNLLQESRYMGNELYPAILSEEIFIQTQEKRKNAALVKNMKRKEDRSPYEDMVFCGECGRKAYRIQHRGSAYYLCSLYAQGKRAKDGAACGSSRRLTDAELEQTLIRLQNRIFDGMIPIRQPQKRSTERLCAMKAKYRKMLENIDAYEKKSLVDMILRIAAEEYALAKGAEDRTILQAVHEIGRVTELQADVMRKIVKRITVTEGGVTVTLLNGQEIKNI